jgi:hypothetical protein
MRITSIAFTLLLASTAASAEQIAVDCKEYQALSGRQMPCQMLKTVKVEKSSYESLKAKRQQLECEQAVRAKYPAGACPAGEMLWPDESKPCEVELAACAPQADPEPIPEKKTVKLWD